MRAPCAWRFFIGMIAFMADTVHAAPTITVHLVPHAHLDMGWLKTVDQYYYGANDTVQHAGVQYSYDAVLAQLLRDPARTWTTAEQGFFQRWWGEQTNATRALVRGLVARGQLVFVDGGWTQHDEGCLHFATMVDQTTYGQRWLQRELGVVPRIGWHLDPFGHTSTQAALLCAETGFDAFYFGRIDYEDRIQRRADRAMEMVWRGSPSLGAAAEVFAGALAQGSYSPPAWLSWSNNGGGVPVMDDPRLEGSNLRAYVDHFVAFAQELHGYALGDDVMVLMGTDFEARRVFAAGQVERRKCGWG